MTTLTQTFSMHPPKISPSYPKSGSPQQSKKSKSDLPNIAPRSRSLSHSDEVDKTARSIEKSLKLRRERLPPRSRFGCWTCRIRKVKCDEGKPECTPCSRLGQYCDYKPRSSFKDDTARVIKKILGGTGREGPVWGPSAARPSKRQLAETQQEDSLPPFAWLKSDEHRERKAEFRKAGTYHLVVNPESFEHFENYREARKSPTSVTPKELESDGGSRSRSDHLQRNEAQLKSDDIQYSNDPDVVILKVFEDDTRKLLSPGGTASKRQPSTPSTLSVLSSATSTSQHEHLQYSYEDTPLMRMANRNGRDYPIIYFYKNYVYRHIAQVHRDSLGTASETGALSAQDVFEQQAANFLPLYHALMAFSALSMSCKKGIPNLDALQHYQKALPSLQASIQSEQHLVSDGVFLTHFILLLYEIAAGGPRGLSFWSEQIDQVLRIVLLRHELYGYEPNPFIIWWAATIDTQIVLSGLGSGKFVETMLHRNLLPSGMDPENPYHTFHTDASRALASPRECRGLPNSLSFHRRLITLAAELGLLARDLRTEEKSNPHKPHLDAVRRREEKIARWQDDMRGTWIAQMPISVKSGQCNRDVPIEKRGILEHSFALYHACLIYSHTSMYSTQRSEHPSALIPEVSQSATYIRELAREIVSHNFTERKYIVFPLFMAGFASKSAEDRTEIMGLVKRMEEDSIGRNVVAARQLLEIVYERQEGRRRELRSEGLGPEREDVDWVGMMGELGLQVVNCRL